MTNKNNNGSKNDTIRVSSSDQSTARKKLQRKFNGRIPKDAVLTYDKDSKQYTYTVLPKPAQISQKKDGGYMDRMAKYQAGGLNQTPMYGANTMPGTPETAQLTYQEADQAKLDALDEQLKEQQESTAFMDEAKANTDLQAAKIAKAEQGLSMGIKGLDKVGVFDKLKQKGIDKAAKVAADKLKDKGVELVADKGAEFVTNTVLPEAGAKVLTQPVAGSFTQGLAAKGAEQATKVAGNVGSAATSLNPAQYGNIGAVASLAGEGIKMASDDQDATTMNTGETIGGGLSGVGTGIGAATTAAMLMGSPLGPVGMAAGAIGGALYGVGKGLVQRGKARKEEDKAEKKQELALNKIKTKQKIEGLKDREYSGYDMGQNLAMYGGMKQYQAGGVALPGGTMEPIPGSDAVEFKGQSHDEGGIMLDPQTEVEGNETMDQVTMAKKGGKRDYFFSQHLKMGGKSFAQRHKDILKNGGSQKNIDQLAKLQEEKAGRDPNVVKLGAGGYSQHQKGDFRNYTQTSYNTDLNQDDIDDFTYKNDQGVPNLVQRRPSSFKNQNITQDELNFQLQQQEKIMSGDLVFDPITNGFIPRTVSDPNEQSPVETKTKSTTSTTSNTNTKKEPVREPLPTLESIPLKTINQLPTDMYNNNSLPGILPYADGTYPNVSDEIQKDLTLEEQNLIDKANSDRELTDAEEKALRKIYQSVPNEALVAAGAQLIPAIYALSRKDAPAEQMSAPGRLKGPQLDRVSYNQERSQNAADSRSMGRFIEQSGVGPAGIIAKMSSYRRKQEGDMKIAAQESRANIAIANQEAQMQQQAEARNIANRLQVDQVNTAAREAERVAQIDRKQEAIDVLGQGIAGTAGDVMDYKANERLAMATGDMGIYERDRLRTFLKGQINPRTGKPYTNSDIATIYNKRFKDPVATKEVKEDKENK